MLKVVDENGVEGFEKIDRLDAIIEMTDIDKDLM